MVGGNPGPPGLEGAAEAWVASPSVRQLRALLRHRASLVQLGPQLRNRIHAVAAGHGHDRSASYWTGPGRGWLAKLQLPVVSREIVTDRLGPLRMVKGAKILCQAPCGADPWQSADRKPPPSVR